MKRIFLLLGLPQDSSEQAVKERFDDLLRRLAPENFDVDSKAAHQALVCRGSLKRCYEESFKGGFSPKEETDFPDGSDSQVHPRLGQLCVVSGIISMEQLEEAVEAQLEQNLALGEILQLKKFISQAELDGLLLGQGLIDMPSACNDEFGRRLILLGLVTEEMILISQMEQQAVGGTIGELVARHQWVDESILRALETVTAKK